VKDFDYLPHILLFFSKLKVFYNYNNFSDMILLNNKDILVDGKPFLFEEWFSKRIRTIMDLLDINGNFLSLGNLNPNILLKRPTFFITIK